MINKKNLWFLTLFSLILVLSVYYITMPSELLLSNNSDYASNLSDDTNSVVITESELITALKVASEDEYNEELDTLKLILMDNKASVEEKNTAFDKMKKLNINKTKEEEIETKLKEEYNLKTFIKIKGNQVKVIVDSKEHDTALANNIMNSVASNFEDKVYVTVQFSS